MARSSGPENRFNDGHVRDRVLKWHGNLGVVAYGSSKSIALQRVLIRCRETLHGDAAEGEVASRVDEEPRGTVVWCIERNLKFDAAPRAEKLDLLARNLLRAASKNGVSRTEIK